MVEKLMGRMLNRGEKKHKEHFQKDGKAINEKIRLYARVGKALIEAKELEPDHRFIKKRVRSMLGLKSFKTAIPILSGVEAMHMMKNGQLVLPDKSVQNQKEFIHKLFGLAS